MPQSQIEVAEYIKDIAIELAKHAYNNGLNTMAFCLEMAVIEALETVARLQKT
jgi:hypothetical protein